VQAKADAQAQVKADAQTQAQAQADAQAQAEAQAQADAHDDAHWQDEFVFPKSASLVKTFECHTLDTEELPDDLPDMEEHNGWMDDVYESSASPVIQMQDMSEAKSFLEEALSTFKCFITQDAGFEHMVSNFL
jgi:hypothetical protein